TGLFGIFCYQVAPRMLTRIEGQPLLIEDLTVRREELADEIGSISAAASPQTQAAIKKRVLPRFFSFGYLMRQYLRKESLDKMASGARNDFQPVANGLPEADRMPFLRSVEAAATLRRIDALVYCHQTMKLWLAPHVLVTSVMLALLTVHVVQVIYFAAR